jgi:hypothetical protein
MLKFIFLCLLIANGLLFALWQGYTPNPIFESTQPQRFLQQKNSNQLTLITAEQAGVLLEPVIQADVQHDSSQPEPEPVACLKWGAFSIPDANKVEEKLKPFAFGQRQVRQNIQTTTSHIILIPPLGSKEAADKKAAQLVRLGVTDFFIIQDQPKLRWGISLGVFKSEEAARQVLTTLISKGVRSAKLAAYSTEVDKVNYLFKNISSAQRAGLEKLQTDFPHQSLRLCEKPLEE